MAIRTALFAILGRVHRVMFGFQPLSDKTGESLVVFHNENSHEFFLRAKCESILIFRSLLVTGKITRSYFWT